MTLCPDNHLASREHHGRLFLCLQTKQGFQAVEDRLLRGGFFYRCRKLLGELRVLGGSHGENPVKLVNLRVTVGQLVAQVGYLRLHLGD